MGKFSFNNTYIDINIEEKKLIYQYHVKILISLNISINYSDIHTNSS